MGEGGAREPRAGDARLPFGVPELLAAVRGAERVLDAGCGSGRLTVALAAGGADVTGLDSNPARLEEARGRAAAAGVDLTLVESDFDEPLPFTDGAFDGVTSRLALMIARDPAATLRELRRVLEPGGRLATALWASLVENPWFSAPRESIAAVLGPERAAFARAFGKLGDPGEAAAAHRAAGLREVEARVLRELVGAADAAEHWERLARENGHFRRAAASMSDDQRAAVVDELDRRLSAYRAGGGLAVPRALVLVTARR